MWVCAWQIKKLEAGLKVAQGQKRKEAIPAAKTSHMLLQQRARAAGERQLLFGPCFNFGRGGPNKALQPGRECTALPFDDAFGSTHNFLVLCDGVGGGGAASGRWARECARSCLHSSRKMGRMNAQPLPVPGRPFQEINIAAEIVTAAYKNAVVKDMREDERATTTLLVLKLRDRVDESGATSYCIDAVCVSFLTCETLVLEIVRGRAYLPSPFL